MVKPYGLNELRKMFLDFFESKGHLVMPSFSLVPHNDKSLLLINAGMAPLKPYFTGEEIPPRRRVATCQKCIRTGDLENVGKTARHGTFFEMLGNFSFGDYFKKEAISWSWEFLTQVIGLDPDRLYPSIYLDDDEAFDIWNKQIGIPAERIFRFGKEDNFWEHGSGPCGPCSEIYYDRGEKYGCGKPTCTVGCDCDRYMEIWNNVFTQFENDGNNNYTELKQKNIDTGMGLERLAVVVQNVDSIFDVDTIEALRNKVCELAGVKYENGEETSETDVSVRIITDHIRSATFMISDGIMPSNEGRGYVLRRLIRRAARHGRLLKIEGEFLAKLSETVIETSKDGYPELEDKKDFIANVLHQEENKFNRTIGTGLSLLADLEEDLRAKGQKTISGEDAFRLYDTYGFPLDLTKEILEEKGYEIDQEGFDRCMQEQKEKARNARKNIDGADRYMGKDATVYDEIDPALSSEFVGYTQTSCQSPVLVMTTEDELTQALTEGQKGTIFTQQTPFYATSGGQLCDTGIISGPEGEFEVHSVEKLLGGKIAHIGIMTKGMIRVGENVSLQINEQQRKDTAKNHSATHLLQKALRIVLGTHVEQAGSFNNQDKLRFDFTHFAPVTPEELEKVENIVNDAIAGALPVHTDVMSLEEARKTGAMALFGEKYGDRVRVVSMGDFSRELCGGTHTDNTSSIGAFKIISEQGVAAGVRRIEALTGAAVLRYYKQEEQELLSAAKAAKCEPMQLTRRIESFHEEIRTLNAQNSQLRSEAAKNASADLLSSAVDAAGVCFLPAHLKGVDIDEMRSLGDQLKAKTDGVVALASEKDGKVTLLVMASDSAVKKGAHAGKIIKAAAALVGGGGGGRPNMAQAGGKNAAGIDDALKAACEELKNMIS